MEKLVRPKRLTTQINLPFIFELHLWLQFNNDKSYTNPTDQSKQLDQTQHPFKSVK